MHPTMATLAPRRAEATAWLAPLPPGTVENVWPIRVSPARGKRLARVTRSMFKLPITTTFAGIHQYSSIRFSGIGRTHQPMAQSTHAKQYWASRYVDRSAVGVLLFVAVTIRPQSRPIAGSTGRPS